jgi:hypothetical protein
MTGDEARAILEREKIEFGNQRHIDAVNTLAALESGRYFECSVCGEMVEICEHDACDSCGHCEDDPLCECAACMQIELKQGDDG